MSNAAAYYNCVMKTRQNHPFMKISPWAEGGGGGGGVLAKYQPTFAGINQNLAVYVIYSN